MKKILIVVAVVLVVIVVYLKSRSSDENKWDNNKITAKFPNGIIQEKVSDTSPDAEIYIDASGSMKPYFKAPHPNDLVNTISEIQNLNYNNTKIYFYGEKQPRKGKVANIITNLANQPNLAATAFQTFFREQACKIDTTNTLIYLVTDGIMSEGNLNMNLNLTQLRGEIKNALQGHDNLAGAILRYNGEYKGDYWNQNNQRVTSAQCPLLKNEITRPYYVIVLGRKADVRWLQSQSDNKLNSPEGKLFMGVHDLAGHQKAKLDKDGVLPIENMNKDVTLILELPECLKEIKAEDVKVMNGVNEVKDVKVQNNGNKLQAIIDPLTVLKPSIDGCITVSFVIKNELKGDSVWLSEWSTDDDVNGPDEFTTFGLSTLVRGMFDGLEDENNDYLMFDFVYKLQ